MEMKIEDIKPLRTSRSVVMEFGYNVRKQQPVYMLNELSIDILNKLCDNYRKEVFEKAGHGDVPLLPGE